MDDLITLKEAARQIGIKVYQARQLVRYRRLRGIVDPTGWVIRVKRSELERFKRQEQKGVALCGTEKDL